MTLRERHKAILDLLRAAGSVDVGTLSLRLGVSAVTIRKDLDLLEEKHLLYRTHGGAIPADPYIATRKVSEKEKLRPEAKRRIGMAAVELLSPQDALIIASGTTVQAFARCIPNMKMTVITSAMNVAMELLDKPDIEIIQLGGVIRHSSASWSVNMPCGCSTTSPAASSSSGWTASTPSTALDHAPAGGVSEPGDDRLGHEDRGAGRLLEVRPEGLQPDLRVGRHRPCDHRFGHAAEDARGDARAGNQGHGRSGR